MSYATEKLTEEKVFKDPVHRYIHVRDRVIWDLIGTREFQRLRRIKQLGTTYLTFHGAEHSRFSHSLGVYEIVRRLTDRFKEREEWKQEYRLLALCAALLHDIGHGPFSHAFEKVFDLDHEMYTQYIIEGDTEVNQVLRRVRPSFPKEVSDIIGKRSDNKLVISMISSQIDADRMDYLLRDAYYTGVSYGNFDLERILRVMRPKENQIVIKASGMHAVEDYIMSRYQMYWQVYFHPVSRSAEVILTKVFHRAKELYEEEYTFTYAPVHFGSFFDGHPTLEDYIKLDESVVLYYFHVWQDEEDSILADLCRRYLERKLFKYVEFTQSLQSNKFVELTGLFRKAGYNPDYYLVVDSSTDLPYDYYRAGEDGTRLPILLQMPNGELRELSRESHIVEAISGKNRTDQKLYFPSDIFGSKKRKVKEQILEILGEKE